MVLRESHVPGLYLCDDDRVSFDSDDICFESARAPVALDEDEAVVRQVVGSSTLSPSSNFELRS